MFRRSTWILLAAFALSLIALWYFRQREPALEAQPTLVPTQAPMFAFPASAITALSVYNQAGEGVTLERSADGAWQVTQPPAEETEEWQVSSAITSLAATTVVSTVDTATSHNLLGLQPAEHTITFHLEGGSTHVLLVGHLTPLGNGYAVRYNDGPVLVANRSGLAALLDWVANPPIIEPTPTPAADEALEENGTQMPSP